jgi:hypothetical protein
LGASRVQRERRSILSIVFTNGRFATAQINPVASKIHDVSAFAKSSSQVGGACAVMLAMSQ